MHRKGFVLTNAALEMETDYDFFCKGLSFLQSYQINVIEFYTPIANAEKYGKAVKGFGFEPLYLTAIEQKRSGFCRLCAEEEAIRKKSVAFTKQSLNVAIDAGAKYVVIQSGTFPENPAREGDCMDALRWSLRELSEYVGDQLVMNLEPCDRSLDAKQLLGPTLQTYSLMESLDLPFDNVRLTMDVAHITELFEDPLTAISLCKPWSSHVHLANCVLKTGTRLFGDKHPRFGEEYGCYSLREAEELYAQIEKIYTEEPLLTSMEMIHSGTDTLDYVEMLVNAVPWFYPKRI